MAFSPSSEQVLDKNTKSPLDPGSDIEKKVPATENNADQQIAPSETIVPDIICQFEEKSTSKSSVSVSKIQQTAFSPVPHHRSQRGQVLRYHSRDTVIGPITAPLKTRTQVRDEVSHVCYVSIVEPKNDNDALCDDSWINATHDELAQFERNRVWKLVPRPHHTNVIGTKWIFKNKTDEFGQVIRNKACLVA